MIQDKIKKIKEQADAASKGPWVVEGMDAGHSKIGMNWWISSGDEGDIICDMDAYTRLTNEAVALDEGEHDAYFIADSRTNVPAMSEALLAVLEIHQEDVFRGMSNGCVVCGPEPTGPYYPCKTVQKISKSLGVDTQE